MSDAARMVRDRQISSLSVSAIQELRRIYVKHLVEVFASPETQELYERGFITGRFAPPPAAGRTPTFIIDAVTPLGVAVLDERDGKAAS